MLPLVLALVTQLASPASPTFDQRTFSTPGGGVVRYGLALPGGYDAARPRPLVLALHPGGSNGVRYYGDAVMRGVFQPGLRALAPIIVAPDVPGRSWTEPDSERAVLALLDAVMREFAVDRQRVAVVGFSMGGAGTWAFSARHPTRFTGAIVMAGRTEEPLDTLARIPTYVIHGVDDQVVPFPQAEQRAQTLERLGRPVRFEALAGVSHYEMGSYMPALARAGRWLLERWDAARVAPAAAATSTPPLAPTQGR